MGTLLEIDRTTFDGKPACAGRLLVNRRRRVTRIDDGGKVIDP